MDYREKRKKLESYKGLCNKKNLLLIELEEFEQRYFENATKTTTGALDKIKTSGGKKIKSADIYSEREEYKKVLIKKIKKLQKEQEQILRAIEKIENLDFQNAVYSYYILDYADIEIAFSEHISVDTARYRRRKGIEKINF